jgi:putative oxidoreductase
MGGFTADGPEIFRDHWNTFVDPGSSIQVAVGNDRKSPPSANLTIPMKPIIAKLASLHARFNPWLQCAVLLFLRITIGWRFYLSGSGKLRNFEATKEFFTGLHIPAPGFHAGLVGYTEMIGGLLLMAGLGTRLASVPLIISMVVAYLTAHRAEGFASLYDFTDQAPFMFLCVTLVTLAFGPGKVSLDACIARWWKKNNIP